MTVIAAIADGQTVWMAADTATSYLGTVIGSVRKIRRVHLPYGAGEVLIAGAGDGAIVSSARRAIEGKSADDHPGLIPDGDLDVWADDLASHIAGHLATMNPPVTTSHDGQTSLSGSLLLGYRGRIWYLLTHQAVPVPTGIAALGNGTDLALGWMLAARDLTDLPSDTIVRGAILAACDSGRIPYCAAPDGSLTEILETPR